MRRLVAAVRGGVPNKVGRRVSQGRRPGLLGTCPDLRSKRKLDFSQEDLVDYSGVVNGSSLGEQKAFKLWSSFAKRAFVDKGAVTSFEPNTCQIYKHLQLIVDQRPVKLSFVFGCTLVSAFSTQVPQDAEAQAWRQALHLLQGRSVEAAPLKLFLELLGVSNENVSWTVDDDRLRRVARLVCLESAVRHTTKSTPRRVFQALATAVCSALFGCSLETQLASVAYFCFIVLYQEQAASPASFGLDEGVFSLVKLKRSQGPTYTLSDIVFGSLYMLLREQGGQCQYVEDVSGVPRL